MNTAKKYGAGMRVKIVPQHWLRGGEIGQLVRFEQRGQNNWLVKFDQYFPGGGIEGDKLCSDSENLSKPPMKTYR